MSVLSDFFAASPEQITVDSLVQSPAGRYPTVQSSSFTPLELAMLEQIATGERLDPMAAVARIDNFPQVLEVTPEGPWVFRLSRALQDALADAPTGALDRWAAEWITAEELEGMELEDCVDLLEELSGLAKEASSKGQNLYVWSSL
jgi:hypothetical protein